MLYRRKTIGRKRTIDNSPDRCEAGCPLPLLLDDPQNALPLDRLIFLVTEEVTRGKLSRRMHTMRLDSRNRQRGTRVPRPPTRHNEHTHTRVHTRTHTHTHVPWSNRGARERSSFPSDDRENVGGDDGDGDDRRHASDGPIGSVARAKTDWGGSRHATRAISKVDNAAVDKKRCVHDARSSARYERKQSDGTIRMPCTPPYVASGIGYARTSMQTKPYEHNRTPEPECREYVQRFLQSYAHTARTLPDQYDCGTLTARANEPGLFHARYIVPQMHREDIVELSMAGSLV